MKKSERKVKLVDELSKYYKLLNVEQLFDFPDHKISKDWLAEVAAILKNLDETDYQEFVRLRKSLYAGVDRRIRINAANEIDGFVRQKVAEYERYDFSSLDKSKINLVRLKVPQWITDNAQKIIVAIIIAAALAFLGLN